MLENRKLRKKYLPKTGEVTENWKKYKTRSSINYTLYTVINTQRRRGEWGKVSRKTRKK
jgi:hypothetical protein